MSKLFIRRWAHWVPLIFFLAASVRGTSAESPRSTLELKDDWRFHEGSVASAETPSFDDRQWQSITLPHNWDLEEGSAGGQYFRGDGWYRRQFRVPAAWSAKRIYIEFDGANRIAEVFLNGHRIGEHRGGYARFRFDLTEAVSRDADNVLAVRVSNARNDNLPPVSADYTFFGGIYRSARLVATSPVHLEMLDHASPGVFVRTIRLTDLTAEVEVRMELANDGDASVRAMAQTDIRDAEGRVVARMEQPVRIAAFGRQEVRARLLIPKPHLWNGRADPYLYQVHNDVKLGDAESDAVDLPLGLRTFTVDQNRGFLLNGRYLDLRGVNRHQERIGKGWATSEADEREDLDLIEEMGCTFVRQCHYQQSQSWNDLADHRGMLMWAEVAYTNDALDNRAFFESAKEQLRELIRQNSQHPAIFFWSIGNETFVRNKKTIPLDTNDRLLRELAAVAREEDPTRLSTYASNGDATEPRAGIPDVIGFNHYSGWYSARPEDFAPWLDNLKAERPDLCIGMSEFGAGANAAQHEEVSKKPEANSPWHPEEWQAHYHEVHWQAMASRPWLWCKVIWCMFDFASAGRNEGGTPGINDKGLVSHDRKTCKDAFYWYKANWSDQPVLYITSRRFTERKAARTQIKVYSNSDTVSVSLNGKTLGELKSENHIFIWPDISLLAGKNVVEAHSHSASGEQVDRVEWTYTPSSPQ